MIWPTDWIVPIADKTGADKILSPAAFVVVANCATKPYASVRV